MKNILFLLFLVSLVACQPSKITQSWSAATAAPKQYKKILILGVLPDNESALGAKMENHLADDLRELGYLAIPANKAYPAGTFVKGDTVKAIAAIEGNGFDGIMTLVLLDKKKQPYYVPGKVTNYTEFNRMDGFSRYLNTMLEKVYAPGYYGEETKYVWENNFYDLNARELIYSARSRSFDFTSTNTLAHTYGKLLVENLVKRKVIQKPDPAE